MKSIIVAYDSNRGIGAANDLLWIRDLPADLKHFKDITTGSAIIMGRRTYESIGRPLPGRQNIVMSHDMQPAVGIDVVYTLHEAYKVVTTDDVYVIGGGQIYSLAIDSVERIIATEVQEEFDAAQVFFPMIDPATWKEISRDHHVKDDANKYDYDFVVYERR
jgi:dihydrofolate reductase